MKLRILFMGSGAIACQTLERLLAGYDEVVAVVTQPDRPKGRKLKVAACAVKMFAESRNVRILSPDAVLFSMGIMGTMFRILQVRIIPTTIQAS